MLLEVILFVLVCKILHAIIRWVSTSGMALDREVHAVFSGTVSLANNGGFASVRSPVMASGSVDGAAWLLSVRGDGKRYRFSIRTDAEFDGISYQAALQPTAGEWTDIRLATADFVPPWRGRVVNHLPPLDLSCAEQIGLLIADAGSVLLYLTARRDEVECLAYFDQPYADYMKRTNGFIPGLL